MSKGGSKDWAAIVYGRTYHLDFRLITVPHDFTTQAITWASQHIVATTQKARNLVGAPRWSLFKNDDYCVMGVTCMVKDLIGDTVKDNQGRPLYVFVGYGTQLTANQPLENFPGYTENSLDNFKILYQEIEQVWLIKNYERDSRYPIRSQYYPISFYNEEIASDSQEPPLDHKLNHQLNHLSQQPDKIYLWQSSPQQNSLLWQASAQSSVPLATCLNIRGKALNNSPFLNQSSSQAEAFGIINRDPAQRKSPIPEATNQHQNSANDVPNRPLAQISQKISDRAKEDIDLTLQQAAKMANASQELINNFSDWNQSREDDPDELESLEPAADDPEFGFKTKKSNSSEQDWF
ncbi:MAG: hypothetical protein RLZZ04_2152 [Cyanobacteriota bacterium]|jgi:hypothetical protein